MTTRAPTGASDARWIGAATLCCAITTLLVFTLGSETAWSELPLDDGWIHLVYARGILRDGLPTYNDGVPEAGFSSFAWLIAELPATLFARLTHGSPAVPAKLTSLAFACLSAFGGGLLVRRLGGGRWAALLAVFAFFVAPGTAFASLSGMEVTLTTAAIVWGWLALADERHWRAGLLFGIAAVARLEATVVLLPVAGLALFDEGPTRVRVERVIRWLAPATLLLAGWGLYNLAVTEYPLPNTFYVKAGAGNLVFKLRYLWTHFVIAPGIVPPLVATALALTGALFIERSPRIRAVALGLAASAVLPVLAMFGTHGLLPGQFYTERYFIPFLSLLVPLVALGADRIALRSPERLRPAVLALAAIVLVVPSIPSLARARESYRGHCATIRTLATEPARWIANHTPKDAVVAVVDAGAMRYHGERRVVDLGSLNDKRLAHAGGNTMLETCLSIGSGFRWVVLPVPFLETMRSGFDIEEHARFSVERWWIIEEPVGAAVAIATAVPRPPRPQMCARYLRERGITP